MKKADYKTSLVVTSISSPNKVLKELAAGCKRNDFRFIVIGDVKSPPATSFIDFGLDVCKFYDTEKQRKTEFKFAQVCPVNSYSRKNIGYLLAMQDSNVIIETDDDNFPYPTFWNKRELINESLSVKMDGWINIYQYFTTKLAWPRGFPLEKIKSCSHLYAGFNEKTTCPVQQGLVDGESDMDAVYHFLFPSMHFYSDREISLNNGWCPFNSQNTTWFPEAFRLLYLPSYCSPRVADIWRSFIAQRIIYLNDWSVLFHSPTMEHRRNEHNILKDFEDEIPNFLHNGEIYAALNDLKLKKGINELDDNLKLCYERLIGMSLLNEKEFNLLDVWLEDIESLSLPLLVS